MSLTEILACSACGGRLEAVASTLLCDACEESFPDDRGVWDLRTRACRGETGSEGWDLDVFEDAYEALGDYSSGHDRALASGVPAEVQAYRYPRIKGRLLDWIAERRDARTILDIGCGVGYFLLEIEERLGGDEPAPDGGRTFVGVDVVSNRARHSAQRFADMDNFHAFVASAEELPFPDGFFDLIVCTEVIEHVARPERAFHEIGRVLSAGGVFCLSSPNRLATDFWERLFSVPRFFRRLASGRLLEEESNPYDQPIGVQRLLRGFADAGLTIEEFQRNVFLPHESYYQFLPSWLNRGIVKGGGYLEAHAQSFAPWLGLHYVVRASKGRRSGTHTTTH